MRRHLPLLALFAALALAVVACGGGTGSETTQTTQAATTSSTQAMTSTTEAMTSTTAPASSTTEAMSGTAVKTCLVTDLAGVDDRSFNASAWQGVLDSVDAGYAQPDPILLESSVEADYAPNLDQCLAQGAQHIVTVGFALGDATLKYAQDNPDVHFTIVDNSYPDDIPNIRQLVFQTDEAAYAAGYLAAGVSQSGIIGTYGGSNFPTVSIFMDGMARGVAHYNEVKGTNVNVLGWSVEKQDGTFTGSFDPADPKVRATCESLLDEGADIILPVGGAINLPCGTAIQDRGLDAALIGVDQDAYNAAPAEYQDLWLTTIEKHITVQVERSLQDDFAGNWTAGKVVGNLANDGIGLAPYHSWADRVPAELDSEVQQILQDIKDGKIDAANFDVG